MEENYQKDEKAIFFPLLLLSYLTLLLIFLL